MTTPCIFTYEEGILEVCMCRCYVAYVLLITKLYCTVSSTSLYLSTSGLDFTLCNNEVNILHFFCLPTLSFIFVQYAREILNIQHDRNSDCLITIRIKLIRCSTIDKRIRLSQSILFLQLIQLRTIVSIISINMITIQK